MGKLKASEGLPEWGGLYGKVFSVSFCEFFFY